MADNNADLDRSEVTATLNRLAAEAGFELTDLEPAIYARMRQIAKGQKGRRGRLASTLNTTALVNEAYLKLQRSRSGWKNREHFFATCASAMRQILVDAARARLSVKRQHISAALDEERVASEQTSTEVVHLHEHLTTLESLDGRLASIVKYKFFLGMSEAEIAELLNVSSKTIQRDWVKARAWLHREITAQ